MGHLEPSTNSLEASSQQQPVVHNSPPLLCCVVELNISLQFYRGMCVVQSGGRASVLIVGATFTATNAHLPACVLVADDCRIREDLHGRQQ